MFMFSTLYSSVILSAGPAGVNNAARVSCAVGDDCCGPNPAWTTGNKSHLNVVDGPRGVEISKKLHFY